MADAAGEVAARSAGGRRRAFLLLAGLLVVMALLRLWYLPHAARLEGEARAVENVRASYGGDETLEHRVTPAAWFPQRLLLGAAQGLYEATGYEPLHAFTARGRALLRSPSPPGEVSSAPQAPTKKPRVSNKI